MGKHYLNVDGKKVLTTEITYEDLVMLKTLKNLKIEIIFLGLILKTHYIVKIL